MTTAIRLTKNHLEQFKNIEEKIENKYVHTIYDKYGNEKRIVYYNGIISQDLFKAIGGLYYKQKIDFLGEPYLEIKYSDETTSYVNEEEYFDIDSKQPITEKELLESKYYYNKPNEVEMLNNKLDEKDVIIKTYHNKLIDDMVNHLVSVDTLLYEMEELLRKENKNNKEKDICKISQDLVGIEEAIKSWRV